MKSRYMVVYFIIHILVDDVLTLVQPGSVILPASSTIINDAESGAPAIR